MGGVREEEGKGEVRRGSGRSEGGGGEVGGAREGKGEVRRESGRSEGGGGEGGGEEEKWEE